jgi:hypothetical protein
LANKVDKHFKSLPPVESEQQIAIRLYREKNIQTQQKQVADDKANKGER